MQRTLLGITITLALCLLSLPAKAATYYVRTDGSSDTNCTGLTDAAYPGSGTGQACAFIHPNFSLLPQGNASPYSSGGALSANSTLVIKSGSYRMGQPDNDGQDVATNINCGAGDSPSCISGQIPDGATIVGCSSTGCGCTYAKNGVVTCSTTRPELWGAGNTRGVLNAQNSTDVTIKDIEITDHANRVLDLTSELQAYDATKACNAGGNDQPTFLTAFIGLIAHSATRLSLYGVNIHGVCGQAFYAANLTDPYFEGVNFDYAGSIGWDNDTTGSCTTCGYTGTITMKKSSVNWNGCIEDWQNDGTIISEGCFGQGQGGYGDGIGWARTAGNVVIEDSDISHNTSDGGDFLYHNRTPYSGGTLSFKRNRFEGNAGNQIKTSNAVTLEDNKIIGNCGFFKDQSILLGASGFLNCRGAGSPIAIAIRDTTEPVIQNNTITSNGDTTIFTSEACSSLAVHVRNNLIIGGRDFQQDVSAGFTGGANDWTDLYYDAGTDGNGTGCTTAPDFQYNLCAGMFKGSAASECSSGTNTFISAANQANIKVVGTIKQGDNTIAEGTDGSGINSYANYSNELDYGDNYSLQSDSPAVGGASASFGDSLDFTGGTRSTPWDIGALDYSYASVGLGAAMFNGSAAIKTGTARVGF